MEGELSVFEQLAASLPAEERKSLLHKIMNSLKLNENTGEYIKKDIPREELEKKVLRDIKLSSWFERFIIRLYTFFTGRNPVDYFLKRSLRHLRRRLNSYSGESYFSGEEKKLSGRLGAEIYSLYVLAAPLRQMFKLIWQDTDFVESVYSVLIREAIHTSKNDIYDFVSLDEMESIFASTGEKNQIRKKVINRMNEYLNSIPQKSRDDIGEHFLPFYFGKYLVTYPYKNLLNQFGCSIADLVEFRSPVFKTADFSAVADKLEQFYYCLNLFSMIDWTDEYISVIAGTFLRHEDKSEMDSHDEKLLIIKKEIKALKNGVDEFLKKTPLLDIIKYLKNDCYYELIFKFPSPDFFEFYSSTLKLRILSGFSNVFHEVRRQYISTSIERIFLGFTLYQLNGYREYKDFDFRTMNLPYFKHISSLMLINNFFVQYYKERIVEVFQVLYKTVLVKNPQLQGRIYDLQKDVEKITHDIGLFDKSLLPEHEDGKTFSLLKNELKKSPSLERKYRGFIGEKDLEAERLIFSGLEVLSKIRKGLDLVISSPADLIRLQLSSVYPLVDREKSLRELIKTLLSDVSNLNTLLKQNLEMEKS